MANTVYTRKNVGRPLTFGEMDANFFVLNDLASGSGAGNALPAQYAVISSQSRQTLSSSTSGSSVSYDKIELGTDKISLGQNIHGNNTYIKIDDDGMYEISSQITFDLSNTSDRILMWYSINDTAVPGSTVVFNDFFPSKDYLVTYKITNLVNISSGDVISLVGTCISGTFIFNQNVPNSNTVTTIVKKIDPGYLIASIPKVVLSGATDNSYTLDLTDTGKTIFVNDLYSPDAVYQSDTLYIYIPDIDFPIGAKIKIVNADQFSNIVNIQPQGNVSINSIDSYYVGTDILINETLFSGELTYYGLDKSSNRTWFFERNGNVNSDYLIPGFVSIGGNGSESFDDYGYPSGSKNETYQQLRSSGILSTNLYTLICDSPNMNNVFASFSLPGGYRNRDSINIQLGAVNGGGNGTVFEIDDGTNTFNMTSGYIKTRGVVPTINRFKYPGGSGSVTTPSNFGLILIDMANYSGQVNIYPLTIDDQNYPVIDAYEITIRVINPSVLPFQIPINFQSGATIEGMSQIVLDANRATYVTPAAATTIVGVTMYYDEPNNNFLIKSQL